MTEPELVFSDILNCDRLSLYLNRSAALNKDRARLIASVLKKRIAGEPVQYILGRADFMGLEFRVASGAFIPRPETEILVEAAIRIASGVRRRASCVVRQASGVVRQASGVRRRASCVEILELGTGSGCIAVSLAKSLPEAEITATDISLQALNIARENARLHGVGVNFLQGDLYGAHDPESAAYDLVVSNPPYIPSGEIERLGPEIRHEPRIALDGGSDGLEFYRRIISGAGAFLKDGGFLILEMGFSQAGPIKDIFLRSGSFQIIDVVKDYSGIERVIVAKKLCPPTFIRKWSLLR